MTFCGTRNYDILRCRPYWVSRVACDRLKFNDNYNKYIHSFSPTCARACLVHFVRVLSCARHVCGACCTAGHRNNRRTRRQESSHGMERALKASVSTRYRQDMVIMGLGFVLRVGEKGEGSFIPRLYI